MYDTMNVQFGFQWVVNCFPSFTPPWYWIVSIHQNSRLMFYLICPNALPWNGQILLCFAYFELLVLIITMTNMVFHHQNSHFLLPFLLVGWIKPYAFIGKTWLNWCKRFFFKFLSNSRLNHLNSYAFIGKTWLIWCKRFFFEFRSKSCLSHLNSMQ